MGIWNCRIPLPRCCELNFCGFLLSLFNVYQPSEAITTRARQDGSTVTTSLSDDANSAASAASGKEVAIVVIQGEQQASFDHNICLTSP